LSDEGSSPNGNHPVSAEPSTTAAGSSNPTPRTLSSTPCSGVRHIQEIEPHVLSQILQLAFWTRKTGYRNSTIQTCVRALKALARRTNLLDTESVKSYLAHAELSENRKTKLLEDVSRFYTYLKIPFNRPRYKRIDTTLHPARERNRPTHRRGRPEVSCIPSMHQRNRSPHRET